MLAPEPIWYSGGLTKTSGPEVLMSFYRGYWLSMLFLLSSSLLVGQDTSYLQKPPVNIPRLDGPILLDGHSDEVAWQTAYSLPFIVYRPVWGQKPREHTEMMLGYDDDYLYVAGRCYTRDSSTIVARTLTRDGWRGDDWATFHIDSRFDKQNALVFSIYPLGSRYDAAVSNDAVELGRATFNQDFNMLWQGVSVITSEGWFFEMKIPLYNLRFKEEADGSIQVGISAARIIPHIQEHHQFPAIPLDVIDPISKPSFKQPAVFSDLKRKKLFLLTPYTLLSRSRSYSEPEPGSYLPEVDYQAQFGLDAKIGISPYLTLDVSVNPDFAQVEADDQLVNLSRFSLFFPEKRLFFQEAAGLFEYSLGGNSQLFYSRQIGIAQGDLTPIFGGLRLTGKLNSNTDIGFLNMQSAATTLTDSSRVNSENFGVLRLRRRTWNDRSFVGFMFTNRISSGMQNYALGTDALINFTRMHYLISSFSTSFDQRGNQVPRLGVKASRLFVLWENRRTDRFHHRLGYNFSGKDFIPALGFLDRSNFHNFNGRMRYGQFAQTEDARFQYQRFTLLQYDAYLNAEEGYLESVDLESNATLRTFSGVDWYGALRYQYEYLEAPLNFGNGLVIQPGEYQFASASVDYFQPRNRRVRINLGLTEGSFFGGNRLDARFSPIINFNKHWELLCSYNFNYLRFPDLGLRQSIHIVRVQLNYALNLHLSANLVAQYNSSINQVFQNIRIRYNFKDGHDLFLVWNENIFANRRVGQDLVRPLSGNQNLILKYNYTFDKLLP